MPPMGLDEAQFGASHLVHDAQPQPLQRQLHRGDRPGQGKALGQHIEDQGAEIGADQHHLDRFAGHIKLRRSPLAGDVTCRNRVIVPHPPPASGLLRVGSFAEITAVLSPLTLLATLAVLAVAVPRSLRHYRQSAADLEAADDCEAQLFDCFAGVLDGFKELKLDRGASDGLFADLGNTARAAYRRKLAANARQVHDLIRVRPSRRG